MINTPWPVQRKSRATSPPTLVDIDSHLPESAGDTYKCDDVVTWAHEATHGVNAALRNELHVDAAFYLCSNQAAAVPQPNVSLSSVAAAIPRELRFSRYELYFVQQAAQWNDSPLYFCDEWVAYTNGALAGMESLSHDVTDAGVAPLEFAVYAACAAAVLGSDEQLVEFLRHELRRSCAVYKLAIAMPQFAWERTVEQAFKTSAAVAAGLQSLGLTAAQLLGGQVGCRPPRR